MKIRKDGTGYIDKTGYMLIYQNGKQVRQHRIIMENFLNRPLFKHENVHHINGDKLDNRIENLEIWSTSQPSGQRLIDKINYLNLTCYYFKLLL